MNARDLLQRASDLWAADRQSLAQSADSPDTVSVTGRPDTPDDLLFAIQDAHLYLDLACDEYKAQAAAAAALAAAALELTPEEALAAAERHADRWHELYLEEVARHKGCGRVLQWVLLGIGIGINLGLLLAYIKLNWWAGG